MELLMAVLLILLPALCAARWAVDSRPADVERATRWWPATPRD